MVLEDALPYKTAIYVEQKWGLSVVSFTKISQLILTIFVSEIE